MFFLRLTLYTCAFYLAIALPIIVAELVIEFWKGSFAIAFMGRGAIAVFASFWGIVWFASFLLAFRTAFPFLWSRLVG
jgi:hypothetical protein